MKTNSHSLSYPAHLFLEWQIFQTKIVEKIKTHILCSITFFRKSHRLWDNVKKNIVQPGRPQMTVWRMRIACWITKASDTHSECVILIVFPLQQRFIVTSYVHFRSCYFTKTPPAPHVNIKIRPEYSYYSASCPCHWTTTKFNPSRIGFTFPPTPNLPQQRAGTACNTRMRTAAIQFPCKLLYMSRITPHLLPPPPRFVCQGLKLTASF
jgi:hypothetical protein